MASQKEYWENIQDYDEDVFSVFADKNAENPIFDYLSNKPNDLIVADYGCGPGNFLGFLAERFKRVIAVDYSENLLDFAQKRNKNYSNIEYKTMDLRNLKNLYNSVDIAISVNSILPENINEADQTISEMYKSIKNNGEFVGILPSADVVFHLAMLEYQNRLDKGEDEKQVEKQIEKEFRENHQTSIFGFHKDSEEDPRQKYFFPFEIKWRFNKAGFKSTELEKVYYSWDYCKDNNYGFFPEHERIWDWFVVAKK